MSHVFRPRTYHPKTCRCGHGENVHPPRLGYACRRPFCLCMDFEPAKGAVLTEVLNQNVSGRRRRSKRMLDQGTVES